MNLTTFTEFRKNAASLIDKVEGGETVIITRHGKPVVELIPAHARLKGTSWKRPALRMKIKGAGLSRAVLADRKKSR